MNCPECNQPLATFIQPALMPTQTDKEYAHCLNKDCKHYYNTQRTYYYEALTKTEDSDAPMGS